MRLVNAIVRVLQAEGVPFLSCYPTTPIIDAAAREGLRPVVCRQERVGVGIADGFARMRNGDPPGVFAMQWGPGAENAFSGIATAYTDHVPMLLLPLGHPDDRLGVDPFFDGVEVFGPVTKHAERLHRPEQVGDVFRRAFARLRNGPSGPVLVEIPGDLARAEVDLSYTPVARGRFGVDEAAVSSAVDALAGAARPVILAGQGVLYADASAALVRVAERLGIPVATTLAGKSAFPEDHRLALGTAAFTMPGPLRRFLREADVLLCVGTSLTRHFLTTTIPPGKTIIHATVDPDDVGKDFDPDHVLLGDARLVLEAIDAAWESDRAVAWDASAVAATIASERASWLARWERWLGSGATPIHPYRAVRELCSVLEEVDSVVTHDSGSPRDQLVPFYRARRPRSYLGWGKSHGLGTGLGLTMGAKLARPDAVCVHVMGDAAFGMVGLDFETAVREEIPIIAVVLNNSIMAIEEHSMKAAHAAYGSRTLHGRYADLARAMDGIGLRVESPDGVRAALEEAVGHTREGRPVLVELVTDPAQTEFSFRGGSVTDG